jgi:hypothetical protein
MMRASSRIFAAGALLLGTICPAAAVTYRWVDDDGVVNLSNSSTRFEAQRRRASPDQAASVAEPQPPSSSFGAPSEMSKPKEGAGPGRIDSVTTEVMRLAGLDFQVDLLAMMVQGEFERLRSLGFRPGGGAATIVAQTFSPDTLRSNMQQSLARSLDQERTRILLAWLRTPLSQRIVALESGSATADHQVQMISFINRLPSTPPVPARLTLIHRLERAGDVAQGSAIVMEAAGAALRRTLRPFVAPAGIAQRDGDGQQVGSTLDENYRLRIMLSLLFTYHDLSDAELGRYVDVLESPTGRWFTQLSHSAFLASLEPLEQPKQTGVVTSAGKRAKQSEGAATAAPKN